YAPDQHGGVEEEVSNEIDHVRKDVYFWTMLTKKQVLETLDQLPSAFEVEDLFEKLVFLQKIEIGVQQSKEGKAVSKEEMKEKLKKWLLK
ncbi:MAG: hypothetical protein ACK5XL_10770, partial [Cyclobacteriaceae bacterium]